MKLKVIKPFYYSGKPKSPHVKRLKVGEIIKSNDKAVYDGLISEGFVTKINDDNKPEEKMLNSPENKMMQGSEMRFNNKNRSRSK